MGCGAGRHADRDLASDGTTSVTQVENVIHHPRTTATTKLEMKEKFWSWSGDDYKVTDPSGKAYIKVDGKVLTARDKMILLEPESGAKMCMIQQKLVGESFNDKCTFQIFTYKPKDKDQKSTETDDGVPVYRFATVAQKLFQTGNNWGDQYNMYMYKNNEQDKVPIFSAFRETWRWQWDSKVNVFKGDQVEQNGGELSKCDIVSKFGMFDKDWWDNTSGNNRYGIEVTTGVDPVLHVCLAIICDAMKEKSK